LSRRKRCILTGRDSKTLVAAHPQPGTATDLVRGLVMICKLTLGRMRMLQRILPGFALVGLLVLWDAHLEATASPGVAASAWSAFGGLAQGCDTTVEAVARLPDGRIAVGGFMSTCVDTPVNGLAIYDPVTNAWSDLGGGVRGSQPSDFAGVQQLAVVGTDLYVAGAFTAAGGVPANNIARWNGVTWSSLGVGVNNGVDNMVVAMATSGNDVYVGGSFNLAGGVVANGIARWDGQSWHSLGTGSGNGVQFNGAMAIAVADGQVYAGGGFTSAGGMPANRVARWDGSAWHPLGDGVNASVYSLAFVDGLLYAHGGFLEAGGVPAINLARWDGSQWTAFAGPWGLGQGFSAGVSTLIAAEGDLLAGGFCSSGLGPAVDCIARWNGSAWTQLGARGGGEVRTIAVVDGQIYAGANLVTVDGVSANGIARSDGSVWHTLGAGGGMGLNGAAQAMTVVGGQLHVGGWFSQAGGLSVRNLARWNGAGWSGIGDVNGDRILALVESGGGLFAGGNFSQAGGVAVSHIARWSGSAWSGLGSGIASSIWYEPVMALAARGNDLFVGGAFFSAGGVTTQHLARWDGSNWSSLDSQISGQSVRAIALSGGDLYIGGDFAFVGSEVVNNIARWDGADWHRLGAGVGAGVGLDRAVNAMLVSGSDLYVAGEFVNAGGVPANRIARWDGSNWNTLGNGIGVVPEYVNALAWYGGVLYAGGNFSSAGGAPARNLAKWDGTTWSSVGSGITDGVNGQVYALAVIGDSLYVGGAFSQAGGQLSHGVARWSLSEASLFDDGFEP
jgi:hypothetical protein